jgi:hypothetical protein
MLSVAPGGGAAQPLAAPIGGAQISDAALTASSPILTPMQQSALQGLQQQQASLKALMQDLASGPGK